MVVAKEITRTNYPLFRKLRPHGVYFSQIDPGSSYRLFSIRLPRAARRIPPLMAIGALTAGSRQRR